MQNHARQRDKNSCRSGHAGHRNLHIQNRLGTRANVTVDRNHEKARFLSSAGDNAQDTETLLLQIISATANPSTGKFASWRGEAATSPATVKPASAAARRR